MFIHVLLIIQLMELLILLAKHGVSILVGLQRDLKLWSASLGTADMALSQDTL